MDGERGGLFGGRKGVVLVLGSLENESKDSFPMESETLGR